MTFAAFFKYKYYHIRGKLLERKESQNLQIFHPRKSCIPVHLLAIISSYIVESPNFSPKCKTGVIHEKFLLRKFPHQDSR